MALDLDGYLPGIVSGDADAFGRWVSGVEDRLRASLTSFAAVVDTEAVVQETLLRVWQVAPRFVPDGRPDGLARLAIRIGRNLAISEARRARVSPAEAEDLARQADARQDVPTFPDPLLREQIQLCQQELPTNPARALTQRLRASGNRHDAELAEEIGMKLNTFLQNIRRARLALARCLEARGISLAGWAPP